MSLELNIIEKSQKVHINNQSDLSSVIIINSMCIYLHKWIAQRASLEM